MKKPTNPTNSFTATEVGAMIEGINTNVALVAEGQAALRDSLEELKGRMDRVEGKVDLLGVKVDVIGAKVSNIGTVLQNHDERLVKLESAR